MTCSRFYLIRVGSVGRISSWDVGWSQWSSWDSKPTEVDRHRACRWEPTPMLLSNRQSISTLPASSNPPRHLPPNVVSTAKNRATSRPTARRDSPARGRRQEPVALGKGDRGPSAIICACCGPEEEAADPEGGDNGEEEVTVMVVEVLPEEGRVPPEGVTAREPEGHDLAHFLPGCWCREGRTRSLQLLRAGPATSFVGWNQIAGQVEGGSTTTAGD
jgi:hypothetical protein